MRVFRLCRGKYSQNLDGKGAARYANRWNSKGVEMVYTSESRALAMAEVFVHLTMATLPSDFQMMEIEIPDTIEIESLPHKSLDDDWNLFPHPYSTRTAGDNFILENEYCVLKVPSAVVKGDFNYLLNPYHLDFQKIRIIDVVSFPFDRRVFK